MHPDTYRGVPSQPPNSDLETIVLSPHREEKRGVLDKPILNALTIAC